MKKWLFNPFIYVAGVQSLLIGWAVMLLTAIIGYYSKTHFDGIVDLHSGRTAPLMVYFCEQLADWGCLVLLLYIAGLIFSKSSFRFIDIAGTQALARWPALAGAVIGFFLPSFQDIHTVGDAMKYTDAIVGALLLAMLYLPFMIWMVVLMYRGFSISSNLKGNKATGIFIAALLLAEIISHLILHQVYKHLI